jgi:hypothetical protein
VATLKSLSTIFYFSALSFFGNASSSARRAQLATGIGGNSQKSRHLASHAGFYTFNRSSVGSRQEARHGYNLVTALLNFYSSLPSFPSPCGVSYLVGNRPIKQLDLL